MDYSIIWGCWFEGLVPQIHEWPQESAYYTELTITLQYALNATGHRSWLWNYHDLYTDFLFFPNSIPLALYPNPPHHPPNMGVKHRIYYYLLGNLLNV